MRISDWSSDVCSSDLLNLSGVFFCIRKFAQLRLARPLEHSRIITMTSGTGQLAVSPANPAYVASKAALIGLTRQVAYDLAHANITVNTIAPGVVGRSEEHTSELQSLMRISYAVFCLKKTRQNQTTSQS